MRTGSSRKCYVAELGQAAKAGNAAWPGFSQCHWLITIIIPHGSILSYQVLSHFILSIPVSQTG